MDARKFLASVGSAVKGSFAEQRSILSYEEYLAAFVEAPRLHARNAAQWLRDAVEHFGWEDVATPVGPLRRYRLFDLPFAPEAAAQRVAGQEEVQAALFRLLGNFVRGGRVNKLVLLHGPNGSSKSSIVSALMRAMEAYSRLPQGALYRFHWVFPSEKRIRGGGTVGFGGGAAPGELASFAQLEGEALDARLTCPLRDHPLLLLPKPERRKLLEEACRPAARGGAGDGDFVLSDYVADGEPCQFCQQVYSAMLAASRGDYLKVLRHVQVERFYVASRYQQAAVTVEPQLSVDASVRQVTADRSTSALPAALQSVALYEPTGPLASANRGLLDYADLLKRPMEAFKYLLGMSESGRVSLESFILHLDLVLIASANEKQLSAFKDAPDFPSFKGRVELVRVPYLRRRSVERQIYDQQVTADSVGRHIAPHATDVAALWAVMTRLKKPMAERYPQEIRGVIDSLSPLEKARLYDTGEAPDRLGLQQAKELRKHLEELYRESDVYPIYEGRTGASARELKTVIFNAAQSPLYRCLTPMAVLEELEALCRDKTVHEFLQQEVVEGYHDHEAFVRVAEEELLDRLDEEIRDSMGMVSAAQYRELFDRYLAMVSSWVKGERIRNKVTGEYEPPDEARMTEFERIVTSADESRPDFRRSLIAAVGAFRVDHPGAEVDTAAIFPDLFRKLREHYFEERKREISRSKDQLLRYVSGEAAQLDDRARRDVERTLTTLRDRYGYCEHCARDAVLFLLRRRYED
jgi:predicted Ser/Thr protein kinase